MQSPVVLETQANKLHCPAFQMLLPMTTLEGLDKKKLNLYTLLFFLLLQAMEVRQGTIVIESKQLEINASIQNGLNKENGNIHFSVVPPNATQNQINAVQEDNEEYAAMRENIQNILLTVRQSAEILMTQASTNVDLLQQNATENAGWLKLLSTLYQVIIEMTKTN